MGSYHGNLSYAQFVDTHKDEIYSTVCQYLQVKGDMTGVSDELLKEYEKQYYEVNRTYADIGYRDQGHSYKRASLVLLAGYLFGCGTKNTDLPDDLRRPLLLVASALQLAEDWLYIHDDIEDESESRKNNKTLNEQYGNGVAMNAGDAVHMAMWRTLKDYTLAVESTYSAHRLVEKFYSVFDLTLKAQFKEAKFSEDLRNNKKTLGNVSQEFYDSIVAAKGPCCTVYGPLQLGAIVTGQSEAILENIEEIGKPVGKALMLKNEKENVENGSDLRQGKITYIILDTYRAASERSPKDRETIDRIYRKPRKGKDGKTEEDIDTLKDLIEKYESVSRAEERMEEYAKDAIKTFGNIKNAFPNNEYRDIASRLLYDVEL